MDGRSPDQSAQHHATFVGSLIAGLFLHPAFFLFFVYYLGALIGIEVYFDRRIDGFPIASTSRRKIRAADLWRAHRTFFP
jgi:hypothetical protein